ncbi:hypothetical protein [Streptomyces sp. TE33382]
MTKQTATCAVEILRNAGGLAGHVYAIDAMVAATARRAPGPVTVLTSDTEEMLTLCGAAVAAVKV